MTDKSHEPLTPRQRSRILEQLDKMVGKGQMTEEEAARLRVASSDAEFDSVIRDVRARHAGQRIDAAVRSGSMSQQEGDDILAGVKRGEHSMSFRTRLRQHSSEGRHSSD